MTKDQLTDVVRDFFDERGFHYEYDAERSLMQLGFGLECKLKNVRVIWIIRDTSYSVLFVCPIGADKDNLGEMMKYLTMVNYGMADGNFEMDCSDGEIRYKTFVDVNGLQTLPTEIMDRSLGVGIAMMNRFGNGIAALSLGFSDAETEYQKANA